MTKSKVLVLGASGILGTAIIKLLCKKGHSVYGQFYKNKLKFTHDNLMTIHAHYDDISISNIKPNIVINCIGLKNISKSMFDINTLFPLRLLNACKEADVKKFIHISSVGSLGASYDAGDVYENYEMTPINSYEVSKAAADQAILSKIDTDMDVLILMPSNVLEYDKSNKDLSFLRMLIRLGFLISTKEKSSTLNFVFDTHIAEYIHDVISLPIKFSGKKILNTPLTIDYLASSFKKIKKRITVIKLSKIIIIRIRSILYIFDRLLPFVSLAKLINKTYEIDSNRVFLSSDSLTAKRFDSDKSREDFIEYLK